MAAISRPDIILGSSPSPFAALAAERAARKLGAQFLLELRDLWPQALVDAGLMAGSHPMTRVMRALESYLYRRAAKLIILAEGSRAYLMGRGIAEDRIVFLPNGVHLGHFQTLLARDEARARYEFDRFTVVYTGAHGPANCLETLVDAGERLQHLPVELVLVGDGPAKSRLVQRAQTKRLRNVRFLDPIPKSEIPALLRAADAGVITLRNAKAFAYGISPNKLFDYMAAERPVLCSVPGDMARLVCEARAGLVCTPEDPAALAQAVEQLVAMPENARRDFGANGRDFLERNYRRETLADLLAATLQRLGQDSRADRSEASRLKRERTAQG